MKAIKLLSSIQLPPCLFAHMRFFNQIFIVSFRLNWLLFISIIRLSISSVMRKSKRCSSRENKEKSIRRSY